MTRQNGADNGTQAQQEAGAQAQQTQQDQQAMQNAAQGADNGTQAAAIQQSATQSTQTQEAAPAGSTVNAHKHQRDLAKVEAERDAAKAELEGYKKLEKEFADYKAEQEAAKTESTLKEAGCHDIVAASARLKEFDGDVVKLKEAAPYLFTSSDKSKSTGGNPKGTAGDDLDAKLDKAFGLE